MRVGLIGAGRMGRLMAERLAAAGHDVTLLARNLPLAATSASGPFAYAASVAQTVAEADAVLTVVLQDDQVRSVCLGADGALAGMRRGATLIQHTTCDPATIAHLGTEARARGIDVLDAALSGGPHDIAAGRLTLWVGGDEAVLERTRPLLGAYASPVLFVGPLGNGQRVKLVNNALFVAQVGLAVDAVRLAGSLGIDERAIVAALQHGSGASRALGVVARGATIADVRDRIGALMAKDVAVVREVAKRAGADLGLVGSVLDSQVVATQVLASAE